MTDVCYVPTDMIATNHYPRSAACLLLLVIPTATPAQTNEPDKSALVSVERAFGFDSEGEIRATNEMAACTRDRRWQDLAVAASNAVQNWPREQYFENWVTALERLNDTASLPDVYLRYMERCPQQRQSLYDRWAYAMRRAGRVSEAIAQLGKWGKTDPKNATLSRCLAGELTSEKRYDEAIKALKDSAEYASDYESRRFIQDRIIDVLDAKGDVAAAIEAAEQALFESLADTDGMSYVGLSGRRLAGLLRKSGRADAYLASIEKRVAEQPRSTKLLRTMAEVAAALDDSARALKYRRLLAGGTGKLDDLLLLRDLLERSGSTNEEAAVIEKILRVHDGGYSRPPLLERLARIHASTGATEKAWALLDDALAAAASADDYARAAALAMGARDSDRANRWMDEALKMKPRGQAVKPVVEQLVALGRHREALDLLFSTVSPSTAGGPDHFMIPLIQELLKAGMTNALLEKFAANTDSRPASPAAWRQLATFYQQAGDYTNAAACWKRVVELTGNGFDHQWWLRTIEKTEDLDARLAAMLQYAKQSQTCAQSIAHSFLQLAQAMHARGRTNGLESISDILLANPNWDVQHENMARIFDKLAMPDRAIRHLQTGLANFEKRGLVVEGDHMRRQLWSLLFKYDRTDEIVECLRGVARLGGALVLPQPTLTKCAAAIGPDRWNRIVENGEKDGASRTEQVMAVFMLSASNLCDRSAAILRALYGRDPSAGAFNLLRENLKQRRDQAALLSLYTNHLARVPESIRNGEFASAMLSAYSAADPAAGVAFAKEVAASAGRDNYLTLEAAQLLQKACRYDDALAIYTNALAGAAGGRNVYLFTRIAPLLDQMGQPARAAVVAFHAKTMFPRTYEGEECSRILERLARKPGVASAVFAWAEAALKGTPVDCLCADRVDWLAAQAWAAGITGDYAKAIAFQRAAFDRNPAPSVARALAALLFKSGSADEAIAVQTRAVKDSPQGDKSGPRVELIRMMVADHRYDRVGALIDETLADAPGPAAKKELDDIRREVETGIRQEAFLKKALDRADASKSDAAAQRSAAQALRLTGRPARAIAYYRRALAADDSVATRWDLAYALTSAGQHKEAIEEYQALINGSISTQERDAATKAIAESYDALGDRQKMLEFLTARLDGIRSAGVRSWAASRIQALRAENR